MILVSLKQMKNVVIVICSLLSTKSTSGAQKIVWSSFTQSVKTWLPHLLMTRQISSVCSLRINVYPQLYRQKFLEPIFLTILNGPNTLNTSYLKLQRDFSSHEFLNVVDLGWALSLVCIRHLFGLCSNTHVKSGILTHLTTKRKKLKEYRNVPCA